MGGEAAKRAEEKLRNYINMKNNNFAGVCVALYVSIRILVVFLFYLVTES